MKRIDLGPVQTLSLPSGIIVMWSGSASDIPAGWKLCNGTDGTPDLRDRFIIGAGPEYPLGAVGGSEAHGHEGDSSATASAIASATAVNAATTAVNTATALTVAQMPAHAHATSFSTASAGSDKTYTQLDNTQGYALAQWSAPTTSVGGGGSHTHEQSAHTHTQTAHTHTQNAHTHDISVGVHSHMPPYYALAFIMST